MPYKPLLLPPLHLIEFDTIDSTNDHARKLAKNAYPSGVVVWAHEQTAGRGRQGNTWVSIPGNLFMSMILRPRIHLAQIGQLSLLAGVALANVLASFTPMVADIRLKWPNDIYINNRKAAGILIATESQGVMQAPWAVIGIGVNITSAPEGATSLHDIGVESYEAGHVLEFLAGEIHLLVRQWERDGFEPVRQAWLHRAYKLGQTITARLPKETLVGVFEGLDHTGALLLTTTDGTRQVINTGEVFCLMALDFKMAPDAVYFVPLGGCGFFGANMALYGYQGQWIMVDCGMGFADDTMPGVDVLLPDPSFAVGLGENLLGIVLTHGHEDHIGAIRELWPRLKKPMYATKFTAGRISMALSEQSWGPQARINEVPQQGKVELGPFSIQYIRMAHSIPEANSLAITVKEVGTILHTGDWKLDADPVEGYLTDEKALTQLGDAGVLAVIGDSTNAMVPGHSGSERTVQKNLIELFGEFKEKIAITCFSTNVSRLRSIYDAAEANKRRVCLVGRSLWKTDEVARNAGYLKNVRPFIDEDEAGRLDDGEIVYVCTGSQGEPRSALSRISSEDHPRVGLRADDVIIFSSRAIPGNERAIDRVKNRFYMAGVNVITDREAQIHVSGHPYRDELKQLYKWTRPKIVIPVHGENMQLEKHAALAKECGVGQTIIPANGKVIEIAKEGIASYMGEVKSGILAVEGGRVVAIDHEAILTRKRMMFNGSAVVTVVIDGHGALVADPKVTALGLLDENSELDAQHIQDVAKEIRNVIKNLPKHQRGDDDALSELVRVTTRRFFNERFDRKPQTRVHLVRI